MEVKETMLQVFSNSAVKNKYCFTFDLWTDKHGHRHFLSLHIHLLDLNFNLHVYLLGVEEIDPGKSRTLTVVKSQCQEMLRGYFDEESVKDIFKNSYSVTDSGTNVMGVISNRLPCLCHKMNNFLEHIFPQDPTKLQAKYPEFPSDNIHCSGGFGDIF